MITNKLIKDFYNWIGDDELNWFKELKENHGSYSPVLMGGGIPHPVQFREGMQIRNWMRKHPDCSDWNDNDYDDNWTLLVEKTLNVQKTILQYKPNYKEQYEIKDFEIESIESIEELDYINKITVRPKKSLGALKNESFFYKESQEDLFYKIKDFSLKGLVGFVQNDFNKMLVDGTVNIKDLKDSIIDIDNQFDKKIEELKKLKEETKSIVNYYIKNNE